MPMPDSFFGLADEIRVDHNGINGTTGTNGNNAKMTLN